MLPRPRRVSPRSLITIIVTGVLAGTASGQDAAMPPQLAGASHVIIPQARAFALEHHRQGVEIESVQARISILDGTARTTLDITLNNPSARRAEAVLLLPVPAGAVVSAFAFEGSAAEPTAKLMPADEARRLYDAIVAKVRDPALLEFAGYNLIRSSVFPVEANGTQRVRLTYEHLPSRFGDRVDYILPRSESLDLRCPWKVVVDLKAKGPISTVYSPSHEIIAERLAPNRFTIRLVDSAGLEPGPFRLSYLMQQGGVTASIFAYPDPKVGGGAAGGYFLLMAGLPASIDDKATAIKREVTIVIDRSGSMAGAKMDQARAAALQVLTGLDDGEAFNIIDYSSSVSSFAIRPVIKEPRTTAQARAYLAAIRPAGGTNIHDALLEALAPPPTASMLPIVLFVTDGLPTIGRTRESDIRDMAEKANEWGRRVFTFGVGHDVNVPLLDRLADRTRATATYVLPHEDVGAKVGQVFARLSGPVFANPTLETIETGGRVSTRLVRELIPDPLPDLFKGDQLILLGQYCDRGPITFRLRGEYLGRPRTFEFTFDLDSATTRNAFVARLWASRRIAYLVDQVRQAGADAPAGGPAITDGRYRELIDEIVRLSTEFGILTEYTAFLATEGTNLGDIAELAEACRHELQMKAVGRRSGKGAVNQGLNYNRQKSQQTLNYRNGYIDEQLQSVEFTAVQQRCDRAFFRRGQRWVDSRLISSDQQDRPHVVLVIGGPEHVALMNRLAEQGRQGVLSLSGEILLEVEGRIVLVKEGQ